MKIIIIITIMIDPQPSIVLRISAGYFFFARQQRFSMNPKRKAGKHPLHFHPKAPINGDRHALSLAPRGQTPKGQHDPRR